MPRDGSYIYTLPFPDVVDSTTIESAVYNGFTNDVAQDLNAPRPIVAGGTGANNAHDAMIALKGEITGEQVTNYDSHPFVAGSFWSLNTATNPPTTSSGLSGICYPYQDASTMTIEVRDYGTGKKYYRQKAGGTWGAWTQEIGSQADADARYVNLTGDSMTGALLVTDFAVQQAAGLARITMVDGPPTNTSTILSSASGLAITNNAKAVRITASGNNPANTGQLVCEENGTVTLSKYLRVAGEGSEFGTASGPVGTSPVSREYANLILYPGSGNNWAGIGVDSSADMWLRAGNVGTSLVPQLMLAADGVTTYAQKLIASFGIFGAGLPWNNSPLCAEAGTNAVWPAAIKGTDRGILYLGTSAAAIYAFFTQGTTANNVGAINGTSTNVAYATTSDGRKKPLRETFSGLDIINRLNPVHHNWVHEQDTWAYGLIAQEAVEVLPQMIIRGDDDLNKKSGDDGFVAWGADYSKAVPVLIRAVQELSAANAELVSRLEALEAR